MNNWGKTYANQQSTTEEAVPRVLGIIHIVGVQEYWPLISDDLDLSVPQLSLDSFEDATLELKKSKLCTYSEFCHSKPAGQRRAPVRSW